jgi:hypothetical protein
MTRPCKEECREIIGLFEPQMKSLDEPGIEKIRAFLERCEKALPSRAAVEKDAKRKQGTNAS